MNYINTKIYKIWSICGDKIYIGATTKQYLSQRMTAHRNSYNTWKNGKSKFITSYILFDEYDISNCFIELLEAKECKDKNEQTQLEGKYIRELDCVNKNMNNFIKFDKNIIKNVSDEEALVFKKLIRNKYARNYYNKTSDEGRNKKLVNSLGPSKRGRKNGQKNKTIDMVDNIDETKEQIDILSIDEPKELAETEKLFQHVMQQNRKQQYNKKLIQNNLPN